MSPKWSTFTNNTLLLPVCTGTLKQASHKTATKESLLWWISNSSDLSRDILTLILQVLSFFSLKNFYPNALNWLKSLPSLYSCDFYFSPNYALFSQFWFIDLSCPVQDYPCSTQPNCSQKFFNCRQPSSDEHLEYILTFSNSMATYLESVTHLDETLFRGLTRI